MKKTLIALTLAALPVAATADVTLFGNIKGGVEVTKVSGVDNTITNLNDFDSSFGIKGHEHIGAGVSAIWQVEQSVSLDNKSADNDRLGDWETYIGLSIDNVGTLYAGHVSDAMNKGMDTLDKWIASDLSIGKLGNTFGRTSARYTGVRFETANFGGFSANVEYSPEDNNRYDQARDAADAGAVAGSTGDTLLGNLGGLQGAAGVLNTVTTGGDVASVGLSYDHFGFFAKYGYKRIAGVFQGHQDDSDIHRVELGYDANNLFVGLGYQYTKNFEAPVNGDTETQEAALTVAYTIGAFTPKLTYATGWEDAFKYDQAIVGVDYALSKRTKAAASVAWAKGGLGLGGHASATGDITPRQEAYTVSIGLSHLF